MPVSVAPSATQARWARLAPLAVVGIVVAANLWSLRATTESAAYLDDASLHNQMVRYAVGAFKDGSNPLKGWFPYLGLGSPQFLHYQSLGAMLSAFAGLIAGGNTAFRWSLYLLLALWPVAIYGSARILRFSPWVAAAAGAVAPLLVSVPSVGYERGAYVWIGYGLWTQLWASWALPFAWATTWRAMEDRRFIGPAAVLVALTIALHFETGYLALVALGVFPWLRRTGMAKRVARAGIALVLVIALCAWVLLPLLVFAKWAAINQVLQGSALENGYGARRVLGWLVGGNVFDHGRLAVVTVAVAVGVVVCAVRWRAKPAGRALLVAGVLSTMLCFGKTTFGSLIAVVPANTDLFFRRFMFGTQLAGIYLAGIGIVAISCAIRALFTASLGRIRGAYWQRVLPTAAALTAACLCALGLVPAIRQIENYDMRNAAQINTQHRSEQTAGGLIAPLIAYIELHGGGRTYAGLPSNWGSSFDVGSVPVFKYLESQDIDEVGYTLRTASLMTDPEYYFDEDEPGDFTMFGIRYLLYPTYRNPPVDADAVLTSGPYRLWVLPTGGYVDLVDTVGTLTANRGDVGSVSVALIRSTLLEYNQDLTVAWDGAEAAKPTQPNGQVNDSAPGSVTGEASQPADGHFSATVVATRRSVVLLSASYDPGWRATVDGHPARTVMLAPALVGVTVEPGRHVVVFQYFGYRHYGLLFGLALLGVLAAATLSFVDRLPLRRRSVKETSHATC